MENLRTIFLYVAGRDRAQHVPDRPGRHEPAVQLQPRQPGLGRRPLLALEHAHAPRGQPGRGQHRRQPAALPALPRQPREHPRLDDGAHGRAARHLRAGDDALRRHGLVHGHRRRQPELLRGRAAGVEPAQPHHRLAGRPRHLAPLPGDRRPRVPRAQLPGDGRRGALPARLRGRGRRRQAAHLALERPRDAVGRQRPDHRHPRDEDAVPDRGRGRHAARPGRAARRAAAGRDPQDPRPPARDAQRPERVRLLVPTRWPSCATSRTSTSSRSSPGTWSPTRRRRSSSWPRRATPTAASSTPTTGASTRSTPPACTTGRRSRRACGPRPARYQIIRQRAREPRLEHGATNAYDEHVRRHRAGDQRGAGDGLRRAPADRARGPARLERRGHRSSCSTARRSTCRSRTA